MAQSTKRVRYIDLAIVVRVRHVLALERGLPQEEEGQRVDRIGDIERPISVRVSPRKDEACLLEELANADGDLAFLALELVDEVRELRRRVAARQAGRVDDRIGPVEEDGIDGALLVEPSDAGVLELPEEIEAREALRKQPEDSSLQAPADATETPTPQDLLGRQDHRLIDEHTDVVLHLRSDERTTETRRDVGPVRIRSAREDGVFQAPGEAGAFFPQLGSDPECAGVLETPAVIGGSTATDDARENETKRTLPITDQEAHCDLHEPELDIPSRTRCYPEPPWGQKG